MSFANVFNERGKDAEKGLVLFSSFLLQYIACMRSFQPGEDEMRQLADASESVRRHLDGLTEEDFDRLVEFYWGMPDILDAVDEPLKRAALRRGWIEG